MLVLAALQSYRVAWEEYQTDRSRLKQAVVFGVLGTMILVSLFWPIWGIHGDLRGQPHRHYLLDGLHWH